MIYRPIKIDCTKDNLKREKISMYEHGAVFFMLTCLNGNQQIDLFECTGASYIGTKPDGHLVGIACEIKDGKVILPLTLQMTTAPGILSGVLVLFFETGNVRFNGVNFEVLECPDEAEIESTDEFTILEDMIAELKKLTEQGGASDEQIANAVDNYLKNNPSTQNGKSAYEIAVENGFEGTEAEWLESLKGKDAVVDQHYNSDSENAQSGKAVDEAISECARYLDTGTRGDYTFDNINNSVIPWLSTYGDYCFRAFGSTEPIVDAMADRDLPKGYYVIFRTGANPFLISTSDLSIYSLKKDHRTNQYTVKSSKDISDIGNYFTDKTIDGALQEIGAQLQNINSAEYKQEIANIIKNEYEAELLEILGGDENVTE